MPGAEADDSIANELVDLANEQSMLAAENDRTKKANNDRSWSKAEMRARDWGMHESVAMAMRYR